MPQDSGPTEARSLSSAEKRVLALLGLPTFGLALAITAVTTYVPLLARQFTSSTAVIGLVIAAEGLVALVVPVAAGAWSDQLRTRIGGRLPFLLATAPVLGTAIALMGFMQSLPLLALLVVVFFVTYYAGYEPYRALYPDVFAGPCKWGRLARCDLGLRRKTRRIRPRFPGHGNREVAYCQARVRRGVARLQARAS